LAQPGSRIRANEPRKLAILFHSNFPLLIQDDIPVLNETHIKTKVCILCRRELPMFAGCWRTVPNQYWQYFTEFHGGESHNSATEQHLPCFDAERPSRRELRAGHCEPRQRPYASVFIADGCPPVIPRSRDEHDWLTRNWCHAAPAKSTISVIGVLVTMTKLPDAHSVFMSI
jgi:hypothetical protein